MEFSKNNDNSDFSNNYNLIIAEIDNLLKKYLKNKSLPQEWYSLKEACLLKGVNYNTVSPNKIFQPLGGQGYELIHNRKYWHKTIIEEWLHVVDNNREAYFEKNNIDFSY